MKQCISFLFLTTLFFSSCKVEPAEQGEHTTFDYDQFFEGIEKVDNCMGEGDSFITLAQRLDDGVKKPLNSVNSAAILKQLYYKAHKRQVAAGPKKEVKCSDLNYIVKDRALMRLSELASEEAIDVFIELYKDQSLNFLGNDGVGLARSMSKCGKAILEKLEPIKNQRPTIGPKVITSIQNGTVI